MEQYADVVIDLEGNAIQGATVQIFAGAPNAWLQKDFTTPAKLYDSNGTQQDAVVTDARGAFAFQAPNGKYVLQVKVRGTIYATIGPRLFYDPADDDDRLTAAELGQSSGASLVGTSSGKLDYLLPTFVDKTTLGDTGGSNLVGYRGRKLQSVLDETISIKDARFAGGAKGNGTADDTAAIQAAINYAKANQVGCVEIPYGTYKITSRINILGNFGFGGIEIHGHGATINSVNNDVAFYVSPAGVSSADAANEYRQNCLIHGLNIVGPGRDKTASVGVQIQQGANVYVQDSRISGFYRGYHGYGALICSASRLLIENCYYGIDLLPTTPTGAAYDPQFSPNDLHFYNIQLVSNVKAVRALSFPNGAITFDGMEIEGNNIGGNTTDGVRMLEFFNAGNVTLVGVHIEENPGEYGLYYHGANAYCHLTIIGGKNIPGDSCGTPVYLANDSGVANAACATIIGTTITNNGPRQLYVTEGFKVTVVGSIFGGIQGYGQKLTMIQDGKMSAGAYIADQAKMRAVAADVNTPAHDITGLLRITDPNGARVGYMGYNFVTTYYIADGVPMTLGTNEGTRIVIGRIPNFLEPSTDNTMGAGSGSYRFKDIYAGNAAINTSDAREKQVRPEGIEDAVLRAWAKVNYVQFKWLDAIAEKGEEDARWHVGVLAQEVKSAFESEGLDPFKYGVLCYDEWPAEDEVLDQEGNIIRPAKPAGNRYGVRHAEAGILEAALQRKETKMLKASLGK